MLVSKNLLIKHGIKPSFQRTKILDYLLTKKNHPNADIIYKDLHKELSTLSLTTVYNTLKLFEKKKLLKVLNIFENEQRFDFINNEHAHFACKKCKRIFDVELKEKICKKVCDKVVHSITDTHIYFKGYCKKCGGSDE
ncbi:MAG: Fur family transcriptional regulator [Candidatus Muiribacteriota bacterium]